MSQHAAVETAGGIVIKDFRGTRKTDVSLLTSDIAAAVRGAELIVIPLHATTHATLAPQLAAVLEAGLVFATRDIWLFCVRAGARERPARG